MPVEELAERAAAFGIKAMALTDINTTMGIFPFAKECLEQGIRPIAGAEIRTGDKLRYILLARNLSGFQEINALLTRHNLSRTPLPRYAPELRNVFVIYPPENCPKRSPEAYEYTGIRLSQRRRYAVRDLPFPPGKVVIAQPVTFGHESHKVIHRHLRAIGHNTLLGKLDPSSLAGDDEILYSPGFLREAFSSFPDCIRHTEKLLDSCTFDFNFSLYKNRKTFTGSRHDDQLLLTKLANDGLQCRYGRDNKEAAARIRHELDIIYNLGFASYFLITWDMIRYSMSRGFYHVGRGSGANSVVAYCLKITDVDPIELDLYFERFINPKRTGPPDFDIDYSWKERDEVLDYLFKRYGRKHTALLGATSTFKGKSVIRELGKVYGLPKTEIDSLIESPSSPGNQNQITQTIFRIGQKLAGFPNLRTIHAGGVLISEEPVTAYAALDLPPKGFPTTQWDMYVAEDIGLEKLDVLSQRGIGHIRESVAIIRGNRNVTIDVHDICRFKEDPKVKEHLKNGETLGCFYIESPAMRGLLKKIRCETYPALVAASSIIRPGVARSGMMREYIRRFHHPDDFKYLHPVMKEQLEETYGVMVYQEDVLKVCHHFAGLDLADADVLRRVMSGKFRSKKEFVRIADKFFTNCRQRGYPEEITREVWRQIESFAGYSFSKAHSASYAAESFQSLYLKAHYPREFIVAVINNFGGFYKTWVYVNEARRYGADIELPCVNHSHAKTRITGKTIYLGFVHIKNLESGWVKAIPAERERGGPFRSLEDFLQRVSLGIEQAVVLIRTGALRFTAKGKKQLLWEAHRLLAGRKKEVCSYPLYQVPETRFSLPRLKENTLEDAYDEIELLGFPVTLTWFDLVKTASRDEIKSRDLMKNKGKQVRIVGQLVNIKYVRTVKKAWMHFAAWLDDEGEFFDTVHFPQVLRSCPFRGYGVYLLYGKVIEEFGFPSLEVEKMTRLPVKPDPRY